MGVQVASRAAQVVEQSFRASARVHAGRARHLPALGSAGVVLAGPGVSACALAGDAALACA